MADNKNASPFMPDFSQGPFSEYLNPARPAQSDIPVPGAKIPRVAAAADYIDKFLQGFSQSRERAYAMQQRDMQRQAGLLTNKINQIAADPNYTDQQKQQAMQPIYKALGQIMGGSIGDEKPKKKKSAADEVLSRDPNQQGEQGVGKHLLGIAKDFATGLAGGKFPKEINPTTMKQLVGGAIVDSDSLLSNFASSGQTIPKMRESVYSSVQSALSALPPGTTREQAAATLRPYQAKAQAFDPNLQWWNQQGFMEPYQAAPPQAAPGTREYYAQHPKEGIAAAEVALGRQLTDDEKAQFTMAQFGIKPSTSITYGPKQDGSMVKNIFPMDRNNQPVEAGKTYQTVKEGGREVGVMQVEGPHLSMAQQTQQTAEDAYREANHLEPGSPLTGKQREAATKAYKSFLNKQSADNSVFDIQVWNYLVNDKFDVKGLGNDAGAISQQIVARGQQVLDELGFGPGELWAMRQGVKANVPALARVTQQGAIVKQLEEQLTMNMDIARQLDAAYKRSDQPFLNRIQNAFNTGTGDSGALNLAAQLHAVSREWAKLMQGQTSSAGVSIREAQDTDKLISNSISSGQLTSLFENVITKDKNTRSSAVKKTQTDLVDELKKLVGPIGDAGKTNPEVRSAISVNNVSGIKKDGSFVAYGSPAESFRATASDITSKLSGNTSSDLTAKSNLGQLVKTWTGETDAKYSGRDLAKWLTSHGFKASENTAMGDVPLGLLTAGIAHFETNYEARPEEIDEINKGSAADKAVKQNSGQDISWFLNQKSGTLTPPPGAGNTPSLPASAKSQLKEGKDTTFANGQVWTLKNGAPARVK